ncbi:uncharacterized protein PITG_11027 [Phytophthora infestans T30-4]|uniref:Uncharacterized protein n=1 Tax=Phytophthora infestans (strain T30-4) TaxID=403677 RepID=D0NG05_PHYIT|nr:uncharacterized protein PITG_11027 [Phytophthora infestans T30-4]EEY57206.1 conserved hypothetical protein [Phytophthora infestans T30-4]|eukprot:XP_002901816.1 conserved hypothetical protein [Phytophthora infestans T30-4]
MGRPSHPAWQYFIRGEKRNRFHYNAYCKFCNENGEEPVAVRGVSGNMIRHLQKCIYCPPEVVTQLKLLCAQKDAASFNKRHQSQTRNMDVFLQEASHSPAPKKKSRRLGDQRDANVLPLRNTIRGPAIDAAKTSTAQDSTGVEDFMPLQLPLLSSEMNGGLTTTLSSSQPLTYEGNFERMVSATLSTGLPWDWMWTEASARVFGDQNSKIEPPSAELLSTLRVAAHEKQIMKMKDEQVGVTLAVNWWASNYPRSNFVLLSLVNALREAITWEVIDMGIGDSTPESLAEKIKDNLADLRRKGIHVINIVAETTLTYAASRVAVNSSEWTNLAIPVLPCFSHLLQMLLGAVLTGTDKSKETVGEVVDLVRMFSNHRVNKVFRRECGDPDAALHAPLQCEWYSFIEAVDSVRQYEDMIKIIASKVFRASSNARDLAGRIANPRKDSAGNTVDELAECGLSPAVIRTIQNAEFWENVEALSELMYPIKEAQKMLSSAFASSFSLSDIFYQFGRMHQQYGIIVSDWEDTTGAGRSVGHVRFLLRKINAMWKLYDQPLMVLGYTFNYNLQLQFLARHQASLKWLSIGKYAKQYFRGWFCAASSTRNPSRLLVLSDEAAAQFMEDILAFKERKYPFDSESMCDFDNPKYFYMLVSDSHPLMHMFGSRLFSFVTSTPPLGDVLPRKCFIPSVRSTTCPQQTLLPLLRMNLFAQTALRPSKDLLGFVQSNRPKIDIENMANNEMQFHRSEAMSEGEEVSSAKKQWEGLAKEWKTHWEKEIDTSNLRALDSFTQDLTLDQIFKDALPSRLPHDRADAVVDV